MKRFVLAVAALGAATSLAACSKEAATETAAAPAPPTPPAPAASSDTSSMSGMTMTPGETMAKGTGTVTAVTAHSVTIDHAPIPEANWPAMTMTFEAAPEVAKTVKSGDKVAFDLRLKNGTGEVAAIRKQ